MDFLGNSNQFANDLTVEIILFCAHLKAQISCFTGITAIAQINQMIISEVLEHFLREIVIWSHLVTT